MLIARIFRPLSGLICLLAAAACDLPAPGPGGGPGVDPAQPVTVALLVPAGSEDAQLNALAQSLVNAARLADGDLRGVDVDLRIYETAGDPARAVEAANQALGDGAKMFVGPLFAPAAAAVAPVAAARGVQVLSLSNNTQIAGGNVYVLGNTFENTATRIVGFSQSRGLTNLGVLSPEGLEGDLAEAALRTAAGRFGAQVLASARYPLSVQGIIEQVPDAARQMRGAGVNALVLTDGPTGGLAFAAETLRGLGVRKDAVQFAGLQRWDVSPQALAQPGLDGGWFAAPDPTLLAQFDNRYRATYDGDPHPLAALAYDGVAAAGALLAEAQAEGRRDPFSPARLTKPAGFAGVSGVFRLLGNGGNERALAVFEVAEGAPRILDPAPRSFAVNGF